MINLNCYNFLKEILSLIDIKKNSNFLIGVSGSVASGKTRISNQIINSVKQQCIYLPFDLWVNVFNLNSKYYYERFFLNDFIKAVQCIVSLEDFMVPRSDLVKKKYPIKIPLNSKEIKWNNQTFIKLEKIIDGKKIYGSSELFINKSNGYVYSFFPAFSGKLVLIDGTLIFPKQISIFYNIKLFVKASWSLRVARMIRRYNRKEIFGNNDESFKKYVDFLIKEAKSCADKEIEKQLNDSFFIIESFPETISNYLDLIYLQQNINKKPYSMWTDKKDITSTIKYFKKIQSNKKILNHFKTELHYLTDVKHLINIKKIDSHLLDFNK